MCQGSTKLIFSRQCSTVDNFASGSHFVIDKYLHFVSLFLGPLYSTDLWKDLTSCNKLCTVKSRFNESRFKEKSRFKEWNLVTKMEFHIKKSRFKEWKGADGGHSLNRDFTVQVYMIWLQGIEHHRFWPVPRRDVPRDGSQIRRWRPDFRR